MKRIFRILAILLSFLFLAAVSVSAAETIRLINHRGYNPDAPENTIPAYLLSAEMGYTFVEADISFTKDGIPVLLHDPEINRTARNADGSRISNRISIGSITYEEALAYDFGCWKGEKYRGTRIPTFEEFLSVCRDRDLHPYIELKANGAYRKDQIAGLVRTVRDSGMQGQVTWISMDMRYLEWVRDEDPDARLGFLASLWFTRGQFRNLVGSLEKLKTGTGEVFMDVNLYMLLFAPGGADGCIEMCRQAGIPLEVWTVDSEDVVRSLDPYITGVTTNSVLNP